MHRSLKIQTFQLTSNDPTSIIENDISLDLGLYRSNHCRENCRCTIATTVIPGVLHHRLWQRIYLCCTLLGTTMLVSWHPSYLKLSISSSDWRSDRSSESNPWRHASCMCPQWLPEVGPTSFTGRVLQQQLPRKHQDVTFQSSLWMTLPHTAELVWVKRQSHIWPWHYDRGRRKGEADSCQHLDNSISSEELHWQKTSPP
jgi:hypothetical protein